MILKQYKTILYRHKKTELHELGFYFNSLLRINLRYARCDHGHDRLVHARHGDYHGDHHLCCDQNDVRHHGHLHGFRLHDYHGNHHGCYRHGFHHGHHQYVDDVRLLGQHLQQQPLLFRFDDT